MRRIAFIIICCFLSSSLFAQKYNKYASSFNYQKAIEALGNDDLQAAKDALLKEVDEHKTNGYAYLFLSSIYLDKEEFGEALTSIDNAIRHIPSKDKEYRALSYYRRAGIFKAMDDYDKALRDYSAAISIDKTDEDFYSDRAQIYYEQEQYGLAESDYEAIKKLNPSGLMSYMGIGRNRIAQGRYDDAIENFDYVIALYPDYSSGYSFRAEAYAGLDRWKNFADDIVKALGIDGDDKAFYLMCQNADTAYVFLAAKLKAKSATEPNQDYWPYCLGILNESSGKYALAIDFYLKSLKIDPDDRTANRISNCYKELGDWEQAIAYMDRAIELDSQYTPYYLTRSDCKNAAGLVEEAILDMDYYISQEPENSWAYYRRGWFKDHNGDVEGAMDDYTTSIAFDPEYAYAYMNRGVLCQKSGKADDAVSDFEMVLQLDTLPDSNSCRQYALFYLGKEADAFDWMQQMLDKDDKGNYYDAACLNSLAGRLDEAVEYLRKAFESGYRRFAHVQRDRDLDNIRNLDSYKALMKQFVSTQVQENFKNDTDYIEKVVEIPFSRAAGVTKVKCSINDLPLSFIFDTGASTVSISSLEATFMYKNDYLTDKDIVGRSAFIDANGDISVGTVINLRKVTFGGLELENVRASVVSNDKAPLLLGQTVLSRLGKVEIDNEKNVLRITVKERK